MYVFISYIKMLFYLYIYRKNTYIIWGLGIGDWGLGIGPKSPIPNPQSPIPNYNKKPIIITINK